MGGFSPFNPRCVKCNKIKNKRNTSKNQKGKFLSYCRKCNSYKSMNLWRKGKTKIRYTGKQRHIMESKYGRLVVVDFCKFLIQKGAI